MRGLVLSLLLSVALCASAQDAEYYKEIVRELSSSRYQGRGYALGGVRKAGKYIEKQFRKMGVDEVTLQPFTIDINTFPGKMRMSVDGRRLCAGSDFVMREYSPGVSGKYSLYYVDTLTFDSVRIMSDLARPESNDAFVVCDFWFTYKHRQFFATLQEEGRCRNRGLIYIWDTPLKFYKAYGDKVVGKPVIWVSSSFPQGARTVELDIDNRFLPSYESDNVMAKVAGMRHDSCYVFIAHYDHLGNLGRKVFFPGANDNASGTAGIMTLASHYVKSRPTFDCYFIAFSGEEANLRGSTYFVEHPLIPLDRIRYLFNLDMIGDDNPVQYCEVSDEGSTGYMLMESLNDERHWFKSLNRGELGANSDHYVFAQRHVPCIMFENEEGTAFPHYHTPEDSYQNAVLTTYPAIFGLVTEFISKY